jgi:hypothetical protein
MAAAAAGDVHAAMDVQALSFEPSVLEESSAAAINNCVSLRARHIPDTSSGARRLN